MMTLAKGASVITEAISFNRFARMAERRRLSADLTIEGRVAGVKGVQG
jgi:UDP-N-acetylglucosamine enolpyruvyl transferase